MCTIIYRMSHDRWHAFNQSEVLNAVQYSVVFPFTGVRCTQRTPGKENNFHKRGSTHTLSQTLTNHSVRATAITNLFRQGLPTSTVMGVSRHRSAASLSSYNQPTEAEKLKNAALQCWILTCRRRGFVKGMKKTKMLRRLTRFCHEPQHQS